MTERRGDQGFAVVTQSVTGRRRRGRGPNRPGRIGVLIVAVAAVVLVGIGLLGPRLNARPSFDAAFFATPTPLPTPEPTYPRPAATPITTPLPVLTKAEDVELEGSLALSGDAFRYLDLATGTTRRIHDIQLWGDAVFATGVDRYVCICFVDDYDVSAGRVRTVDLVTIVGDDVTKTTLDRLRPSAGSSPDQPDPLLDVAVDHDHRLGLLAVATRTKADWRVGVRPLDIPGASLEKQTVLGRIALPAPPAGASPTPVASDQPSEENVYLDGPHIRMAPDGRTAVVWALGQRYSEDGESTTTQGAWRIRLGPDGSVDDVAEAPDLTPWPQYCGGIGFSAEDRLAALCADPNTASPQPAWFLRTFDADGRKTNEIRLPESGDFGYSEPLFDQANHRMYLWDPIALRIVRIDLDDGSVQSTTFDSASSSAAGVTSDDAALPPEWHDGDSAVQQALYESVAGSADGRHLYAVGMRPNQTSGFETYGVGALGVFVIDPATLALEERWAPAANDVWVATLPDGRVVTGGNPGLNIDGEQVQWEGSLTIRDAADGRILARYGRVSIDQAPVLVGP